MPKKTQPTPAQPVQLRQVDPRSIQWPEVRVNAYFSEEQAELLRASVAQVGIQAPIICLDVDGVLYGVDGLHRCQEALRLGKEQVDVVVSPGEEKDIFFKNLVLNTVRGKPKASEMVAVMGLLFDERGVTIEELVQRSGLPQAYVEQLVTISRGVPGLRQALDDERLAVGAAYHIARIEDPLVQERVLYQHLIYRWTVNELKEHIKHVVDAVEERKARVVQPAPQEPARAQCVFCRDLHDTGNVATRSICVSCAGKLLDFLKAERGSP